MDLFIAIWALILPAVTFAFESNFYISTDLGIENQSFDLTSVNFPTVSYNGSSYTVSLVQDTFYHATLDNTDSTYTPSSKLASNAARFTLGAGWDLNAGELLTLRAKFFSSVGNRALVNTRYYMYAPGISTSLTTVDNVPLPNILPNSTEMIQITQGPNYGLFFASLYKVSDRYSVGPSYALTRSRLDSSEYLLNESNTASSLPYYTGSLTLKNQAFGALGIYRITNQTNLYIGIESSKQYHLARKEIYFTNDGSAITGRDMPSFSNVTTSNWNGVECINDVCSCTAGSDCTLTGSGANYTTAPHLNLSRILTRFSIGFDFSIGQSDWQSI